MPLEDEANLVLNYTPSSTVFGTVIATYHGGFDGTVHWCVSSFIIGFFLFTVSGEAVRLKPSHKRSSESGM